MPDYKEGKVYMIWSPNTDKVYIGSTVQPLHKRLHGHKKGLTGKRYMNSREVLECGEARIELIEDYPCAKKSELNRREGQIMRGYDNRVNKQLAGRTKVEYRADNREVIAAQKREYYLRPEVKEHITARMKEYRQRPEVKERRNALERERRQRQKPEVRAHIAAANRANLMS